MMSLLNSLLVISLELSIFFPRISNAGDSIAPPLSLRDGDALVSKGGTFVLGFFSPGRSQKRYLGIWFKNVPVKTVVWVANRELPISGSSGVLKFNDADRTLMILNEANGSVIWSASPSPKNDVNPVAQLLDSGNFVLRDEKDINYQNLLWQSFDYPTDTLLQGMKFGWDSKTGLNRRLVSWKSAEDPSPGDLINEITKDSYPQGIMWRGSTKFFRSGPWNGIGLSGAPDLKPNPIFDYQYVSNKNEVYYTYNLKNNSVTSIIVLNQTTNSRQRYIWEQATRRWKLYAYAPRDQCDSYGVCGANSVCIMYESPICQCLKGFKPKSPDKWNAMDWSDGCTRNKPLQSYNRDGFAKFKLLKLPDSAKAWVDTSIDLQDCKARCLANDSCTAYTNSDISGKGSGCVMWFDDLVDIRQSAGGQDLYVRLHQSELGVGDNVKKKRAIIAAAVTATVFCVLITSYCIWKWRINVIGDKHQDPKTVGQNEEMELPCFSIATIVNATGNFSLQNKLGEGGFGPVYRGTLLNGQQIAVKRLSVNSGQGLNELKNEVTLIASLQHRNLIKLLGYCIEGEECMLIYEYMPNKSLDNFIFDKIRRQLQWPQRFNIICGVARGLLYLHQDSRLRIIHRDIKANNVLLDDEMNPKISDFGLARSFGSDETTAKTKRIVGTYGYMPPEYVVDGLFSTKSDVFSFGVLLLEIVSGERNSRFHHSSHNFNLIGHAWKLWEEGKPLDLIDALCELYCLTEVLRCIHVGLLCVQQSARDRPNMSFVVQMLVSELQMPQPKLPGFFIDRNPCGNANSLARNRPSSRNKISTSTMEAR